jgi:hypothetical protein
VARPSRMMFEKISLDRALTRAIIRAERYVVDIRVTTCPFTTLYCLQEVLWICLSGLKRKRGRNSVRKSKIKRRRLRKRRIQRKEKRRRLLLYYLRIENDEATLSPILLFPSCALSELCSLQVVFFPSSALSGNVMR